MRSGSGFMRSETFFQYSPSPTGLNPSAGAQDATEGHSGFMLSLLLFIGLELTCPECPHEGYEKAEREVKRGFKSVIEG